MTRWFLVFSLVTLVSGAAWADDARRLRVAAATLVQMSERAESSQERLALLEEAHGKLVEIQERYPSESTRLLIYLGGERTTLSLDRLHEMIAPLRLAELEAGKLRAVLGRALSPTTVDENGWADLHFAAALDLPELVGALLDAGADVAARLKSDKEPLSARLKQSLTALGLVTDIWRYAETPLHMAAWNSAREAAETLIHRGADVNAKNGDGMTPLHIAAWTNAKEAVATLIAGGADVNARTIVGWTPLHVAASANAGGVATVLVDHGADIDAKTDRDETPQHIAEGKKHHEVVKALKREAEVLRKEMEGARQDAQTVREAAMAAGQETISEHSSSTRSRDRINLLNQQIAALRLQLQRLEDALQASKAKNKATIADLGRRLKLALAHSFRKLSKYRSGFFGRLREVLGDRADITVVGDRFVFQSEVLFESGSADLGQEGQLQLGRFAETLREISAKIPADIPWIIRVDGHTDQRPISTTQFPSNWELSTARAIAVTRFLQANGIPPERLAAAGFGEFQPLDPRHDMIAFRRNRRIEIKLTER